MSSTLYIGNNTGSSGTYALSGGLLKAGTITKGSGTTNFDSTGGTLSVDTFNGALNVQSGATLSPGNSPGLTTVNGDFTNSGTIIFELGGTTTRGTDYDAITEAGGDGDLGGTLQIKKDGTGAIAEDNTTPTPR